MKFWGNFLYLKFTLSVWKYSENSKEIIGKYLQYRKKNVKKYWESFEERNRYLKKILDNFRAM